MHHASPVRGCVGMQDAVQHRVAQVHVARRHVDLGPQHARAVGELAGAHAAEQVEVLRRRCGRGRGCCGRARSACRAGAHLLGRLVVDIGQAVLGSGARPTRTAARNSPRRDRGAAPQSKPSQRTSRLIASMYSCSSLVGLVSSKRRWQRPPNSCGDAEIEADRLGVADMQVAVRLRRKPGHDLRGRPASRSACDDVADEIPPGLGSVRHFSHDC